MSATTRRPGGGPDSGVGMLVAVAGASAVVGGVALAAHLGPRLAGTGEHLPADPFTLTIGVLMGRLPWPHGATPVLIGESVVLAALGALVALLVARRRGKRTRVDAAARHMGSRAALASLTDRGARATARRLGATAAGPGLPIAAHVPSGQVLYSSWEDVALDVWGPRTGKTSCRAIPAVLTAPGAVLATSNRRDLVDATRDPRAGAGTVWVFDPQAVAGETPAWWWDPLTYVVDETRAAQLARVFATASRDEGARTDAYFDTAAQSLLANLLLGAAAAGRPITEVYRWLTRPTDDEPAELLRAHGYAMPALAVDGVVSAPDKQRGGVYGTALQVVSFLTSRAATAWVTPTGPGDRRPRFDLAAFVASTDTLYSLSREGAGSAGPLVAALTMAVVEAAEAFAARSPGGRLPTPMVMVLDEAANVCRWQDLPDFYSHFGGRGIVVATFLQSWSQGVAVWGREGMRKLWSAANVKVYGGGVAEVDFLADLSQLVGDHDVRSVSTSTSSGQGSSRSTSRSYTRERVLDVADLAAFPRGRVLVLASGAPPALARTLPWMTGPHAAAIAASIRAHDPAAEVTLADAAATLEELRAVTEHRPGQPGVNPWLRP